ncbi:hypothetical protein Tco_0972068 [Tanacetum coccineum]
MANLLEDIQCAGSDTRPPMLNRLSLHHGNNVFDCIVGGRFVTAGNEQSLKGTTNYDQLYAYLKQHEAHVNKNKMMLDRFTQHTVDPLALMSIVSHHQVDRIEVRGIMHGVQVQLFMGELRTELGMQIQENVVALDEKQLLFIASGQDNVVDDDVDEQPVQDLALNVDNVFQDDDCDAFDYDVDEAPTVQIMFIANLSSADPVYRIHSAYESTFPYSEVPDHDNYHDVGCEHHEVHKMHDDVQPRRTLLTHIRIIRVIVI